MSEILYKDPNERNYLEDFHLYQHLRPKKRAYRGLPLVGIIPLPPHFKVFFSSEPLLNRHSTSTHTVFSSNLFCLSIHLVLFLDNSFRAAAC